MTREELKVSIIIKGDRIFLGAQATSTNSTSATSNNCNFVFQFHVCSSAFIKNITSHFTHY